MSARMVKTKHPGVYATGTGYLVKWRDGDRQCSRSFATLAEARKFKAKTTGGETRPTSRQPFSRYADEWLAEYGGRKSTGISAGTIESYRYALDHYAKPFFGSRKLDAIGPKLVDEFIASLAKQGLAPNTIRRYLAPVKALFATAVRHELIASNPTAEVRVTVPDTRPVKPKRLTVEQTRALLAEIPAEHADLVYLLATTGLRISEALNVRWDDLTVVDGRPHLTVTKSKTAAGLRTIPLDPATARRLTKRRATATSGWVFPSRAGTPLDARNWRRNVFRPAAERAGVAWATPHKLRHTQASIMLDHGYTDAQVANRLGHADGGVLVKKIYGHPEQVPVDFMGEVLGGVS